MSIKKKVTQTLASIVVAAMTSVGCTRSMTEVGQAFSYEKQIKTERYTRLVNFLGEKIERNPTTEGFGGIVDHPYFPNDYTFLTERTSYTPEDYKKRTKVYDGDSLKALLSYFIIPRSEEKYNWPKPKNTENENALIISAINDWNGVLRIGRSIYSDLEMLDTQVIIAKNESDIFNFKSEFGNEKIGIVYWQAHGARNNYMEIGFDVSGNPKNISNEEHVITEDDYQKLQSFYKSCLANDAAVVIQSCFQGAGADGKESWEVRNQANMHYAAITKALGRNHNVRVYAASKPAEIAIFRVDPASDGTARNYIGYLFGSRYNLEDVTYKPHEHKEEVLNLYGLN